MAKKPIRPRDEEPEKKKKKKRGPLDPGEPGTETSADTRLVNALESDPEFFKDPLIGQTVGKCRITKFLGQGRTAAVYQATYQPLKRTVAVKVLQPEMTKFPAVVRVFQQEGRAVAALDHENVVKIYDVGEDKGNHYLVLELLHGETVLKKIESAPGGRLPVAQALDYTRQAAAGLAAAQAKKLVHRDIKPQNLVIEPDGTLKIVDFGLAAEAEGAFAGGRLGTPHYMSPEVCRGELATTASDIYALGVTLFHMLVGQPPYAGRKTTEEIIAGHLAAERLQPEKLRSDIPRPVAELVRRMTRQDPASRPTAQEIVQIISERLTPERLGARHQLRGGRRPARARSRQSSMGVAIVAGVVLLVALVFLLTRSGSEPQPEPQAQGQETPPTTSEPEPEPDRPPPPREIEDKGLERDLRDLLDEAKREERTGNFQEALLLYQRVVVKSPEGSRFREEAKAAAELVRDRLKREKGEETSGRKWISARESERAGQEFEERHDEFWRRLADFDVPGVKADIQELIDRTREGTPERKMMEETVASMRYVESLLGIMQARAASLSRDDADWSRYDMDNDKPLLVIGADAQGIHLRDEDLGTVTVKPWSTIDGKIRIQFLEALRNPSSASETLWLGAYCLLLGDDAADQYFNYAMVLDGSPEMRSEVAALREGK